MSAPELKPCPFCGGKNIGWVWREAYSCDSSYAFFGCIDCQIGSDMADEDDKAHPSDVDAWNSRADLPPTLEQVKALPEIKALVEAAKGVVDGWDWWTEDQFDRCQSVPADAIEDARAALRAIGEGRE